MTPDIARIWIIKVSLIITSLNFAFFLIAPVLGYPITFEQSIRILEIITPVFFSYLGSATYFLFSKNSSGQNVSLQGPQELLNLLVKGPIWVFGTASLAAVIAFGYSNSAAAPIGSGMTVDFLAGSMTAALGLLAVTTNVIVSYLFSSGEKNEKAGN